jgi:hypothetical protein
MLLSFLKALHCLFPLAFACLKLGIGFIQLLPAYLRFEAVLFRLAEPKEKAAYDINKRRDRSENHAAPQKHVPCVVTDLPGILYEANWRHMLKNDRLR